MFKYIAISLDEYPNHLHFWSIDRIVKRPIKLILIFSLGRGWNALVETMPVTSMHTVPTPWVPITVPARRDTLAMAARVQVIERAVKVLVKRIYLLLG